MDREAAYVREHVSPADRILDVGWGIDSLEARFAGSDIVWLDRSGAMVRTARERVAAPFVRDAARALPIPTGAVDAVVFVATLAFVPEIETVRSEAVRILDSEGTFVALLLNANSDYVRSNLDREESYVRRMVHRDTEDLTAKLLEVVDGTREDVLGIEDGTVVERSEPATAAMTAVVGTPVQ